MTNESAIIQSRATEKLVEALQEFHRSPANNWKMSELIGPVLAEAQELRQYLYKQVKFKLPEQEG